VIDGWIVHEDAQMADWIGDVEWISFIEGKGGQGRKELKAFGGEIHDFLVF
jgi:hypothetical protein